MLIHCKTHLDATLFLGISIAKSGAQLAVARYSSHLRHSERWPPLRPRRPRRAPWAHPPRARRRHWLRVGGPGCEEKAAASDSILACRIIGLLAGYKLQVAETPRKDCMRPIRGARWPTPKNPLNKQSAGTLRWPFSPSHLWDSNLIITCYCAALDIQTKPSCWPGYPSKI